MSPGKTVIERIRTVKILEILRSGSLTTVQDLGRVGYAQYGVPAAGAMDSWSLQVGNILVGNLRNTGGLEMTMGGARIRFLTSTVIAVTGGQGLNTLNGQLIENWKSIQVKPGDMLDIGIIREGCRAYLAIAGGIRVPKVLGSCSTYIPAALGGLEGRALVKGDILKGCVWEEYPGEKPLWEGDFNPRSLSWRYIPDYSGECTLRVVRGIDAEMFASVALNAFYSSTYTVSGQSDRMGCRLEGSVLNTGLKGNRVSDAVVRGGIQVPPNGQPIILGAEQTIGGYPIIAVVASVDYPLVAQSSIKQRVRFEEISYAQAESLRINMENFLRVLANANKVK